ncbi:MAG: trypsin-like peptidase domain-containing protein [Paludibacteraceae bacterium]|nr:trypsin-like peptidase domain-containing protein [Paludibacteraceae bacterium]
MRRYLFLLISLLCAAMTVYSQNPFESSRQPSEWSGTGWMLNKGYVVTNHHVANNARTIILKFMQGDSLVQYTGETVVMDEEHDLAIIKINDPAFKGFGTLPYAVKTSLADVGESVFVLGYPLTTTMGDEIKLTTGIISSHSGYEGNRAQYQISAPVQPGNSGGPLFDESGNVIAVVNAKHTGAENVGYAVKAQHLQDLVNRLSDKAGVLPTGNSISQLNLPQKVKRVKGLVCFIYCSTRGETPRSAQPKHGAPDVPQGAKVIENPYIDNARTEYARIARITITDKETIVEMTFNNETENGFIEWIQIAKETTIETDDQEYTMKRAEGIAIAPGKTTFSRNGETKTFRLIFPAIPKSTTSINLVEPGSNGWKFYGISLKEY